MRFCDSTHLILIAPLPHRFHEVKFLVYSSFFVIFRPRSKFHSTARTPMSANTAMRLFLLTALLSISSIDSIVINAPWIQSGLPQWCNTGTFLPAIGDWSHSQSSACVSTYGPTNCKTIDNWWTPGSYVVGGQTGYCSIPGNIVQGITGPYVGYLYTSYYTICGGQPAVASQNLTDVNGNSYGKYYGKQ